MPRSINCPTGVAISSVICRDDHTGWSRPEERDRHGVVLKLGRLAADLGFADQAHLCRTVRAHLGRTPSALRTALRASTNSAPAT
jgi:AraC-like DNA-binding protein